MSDQNKALARRMLEDEISNANFALTEQIIHPDFYDHTNPPGLERGIQGHQAIIRLFKTAFPDMRWEIQDLIAEGDRVVARTVMTATHGGDFFGIPATGRTISSSGVHIMRVLDGKIIEHWGNNDDLGVMRQLGVVPG